jgi:hypothetical protein
MTAALKTPLGRSLNLFAERKVTNAIELLGKALPAQVTAVSGSIVTVKFLVNAPFALPTVTIPLFGPEYIRYPIQKGCQGVVFPSDVRLGGITGLGSGTPDLTLPANLSSLVFFPVANANWSATDDPNKLVLYGPDGVVIRTVDSTCKITIDSNGVTVVLPAGKPMTVNGQLIVTGGMQLDGSITAVGGGTFAGNLETSGDIVAGKGGADQVGLQTHDHGGVQTGSGTSGPPTPGT